MGVSSPWDGGRERGRGMAPTETAESVRIGASLGAHPPFWFEGREHGCLSCSMLVLFSLGGAAPQGAFLRIHVVSFKNYYLNKSHLNKKKLNVINDEN